LELWVLTFVPLGIWVWLQQQRIDALSRRIADLELRLLSQRETAQAPVDTTASAPAPVEFDPEEALVLTEVVPDDVLVLDTPLPEPSNDTDEAVAPVSEAQKPQMHSPLLLDESAASPPAAAEPPRTEPEPASARPADQKPFLLDRWLAENGLEALGVFAIGLAFLAPALANAPLWSWPALTGYVGAVGAAGFALAMVQRWSWLSLAALAGVYVWFVAAIATDDLRRALALLSFASLGGVGVAFRAPSVDEAKTYLPWSRVRQLGPSVAISVSSALLIWAWLAMSPAGAVVSPALISIFHVVLAAYAVRERLAAPATLAIAISALVLGFMAFLRGRFPAPVDWSFYPAILSSTLIVIASALAARPHRTARVLVAAAGSMGAALATALAAASRPDWDSPAAWAPLFIGAAALFAAAWRQESVAQDRRKDTAVDLWGGCAAALMLLGIESVTAEAWRGPGQAGVALLFGVGLAWRGWRVLGWAALAAAALAVAHSLSPAVVGATLGGAAPLWFGLLVLALTCAVLFAASTIVRRNTELRHVPEGLSAASVMAALVAVFVLLRWIAAGGAGIALHDFTEISLRALVLMAAGLALLPRIHENPGPIGAWRGHVLIGLGLVYALLAPGLGINPWWGGPGRAVVNGLPLLNANALAFLAPAALAFVASGRLYGRQILLARLYAAAGTLLALIWAIMEIRHGFHGAAMAAPVVGLFESACYALLALASGLGVAFAAGIRTAKNLHRPFTQDLTRVRRGAAWTALGLSLGILLIARHPIWGAQDSFVSNAFSTLLAVIAQFAAAALAAMLGRALSVTKAPDATRFAAAAAASLLLWSAGHGAIRWLHHRGYMDDGAPLLALEGLLHAVWPLALVVGIAGLTRAAPGRDTVRAYLSDLQALWATAIWPALAFAGLGFWLLFNPWWGVWPAQITDLGAAIAGLGLFALAAVLSNVAPDVPQARWLNLLVPAATIACAAHLFVLATVIVRWLYHGAGASGAAVGDLELWAYSAVWALFATAALALGAVKNEPVLRWIGVAVFAATFLKVAFVDTAELSVVWRAAVFVALVAAAGAAIWLARRNRTPPGPGDLVTVKPSARRERRRVRRRTSQ
jgi:uncharacterized membrane protein